MNKSILIIEDDNFLQGLASRKLQNEGFIIFNAPDAAGAFKVLENTIPSMILLDLLLPGVDGFEILKKIRGDARTKNIPVIVFSNLSEDKDITRAKELGINEFMVKSNFTLDELTDKIKMTLK